MNPSDSEHSHPEELNELVDLLREQRPELEAHELDRIKLRAMTRARRGTPRKGAGLVVRTRMTALLTTAFVALGTGGAFAWGGGLKVLDVSSSKSKSASFEQYHPPCPPGTVRKGKKCVPKHKGKELGGYGQKPPPPGQGVKGFKSHKKPKHHHHKK